MPEPSKSVILEDLLLGLRRFKSSIRWKSKFDKDIKNKENSTKLNDNEESLCSNDEEKNYSHYSLGTGIYAPTKRPPPPEPPKVEAFLDTLERELIRQVDMGKSKNTSGLKIRVGKLVNNLKKSDKVIMPTDKTNSCGKASIQSYSAWIEKHTGKNASET